MASYGTDPQGLDGLAFDFNRILSVKVKVAGERKDTVGAPFAIFWKAITKAKGRPHCYEHWVPKGYLTVKLFWRLKFLQCPGFEQDSLMNKVNFFITEVFPDFCRYPLVRQV